MCRGSSLHGAVCLSESSSANSSDKLSVPQPGSHVTTGGLSIEHVEEIPRFQFGSLDQFDWFKVFIVGFITGSLELRIESLRLFFESQLRWLTRRSVFPGVQVEFRYGLLRLWCSW